MNGYVECLQLLIGAGASFGEIVALNAIENGQTECLRLLISVKCPIQKNATTIAAEKVILSVYDCWLKPDIRLIKQ